MASPQSFKAWPLEGRALWWAFAAATTGTFMVNVDSSAVNVALPTLQSRLGLPLSTLQWVVTAYLLVITGLLPVAGQIADRLGRKSVFITGMGIFTVGSFLCSISTNVDSLIVFRVIQGAGGAAIMSNVMAIIALIFPPTERGRALGIIGSVVAAGTLAGPPLGGILTGFFGWRSIFWINIPFGIWGIIGSHRFLPTFAKDLAKKGKPFDFTGAILFLAVTGLLQFGIAHLHQNYGLVMLLASFAAGTVFAFVERKANALVPLQLFSQRAFTFNMIAGVAYWILMMYPAFLMPFYLTFELHLSVQWVGLSLVPQAAAMVLVSPWGGRLTDRYGVLLPARIGMILFFITDLLLGLLPGKLPLVTIWILLFFEGIAAGLFSSPNSTAILGSVTPAQTGLASSLMATERNLGRSIGVGFASVLLSVVWGLYGIRPAPSHTNPHYPALFLLAFHGVFLTGILFATIAFLATVTKEGSSFHDHRKNNQKIPNR